MKLTLFDLYRSPLNVWVEDPLTHAVLTDLWADTQINVLVTHGKPGVNHMVLSNQEPLRHQVYGIVDRDFDDGNEGDWERPSCRVLRTPTHEMENLLLDFDVLAALSGRDSAGEIRARAHACAQQILFWMVCKAVIRDMQHELGRAFPGDPAPSALRSLGDVEAHLGRSPYWSEHGARWTAWAQPAKRDEVIQTWHELLRGELDGDGWLSSFSGKEIFTHLRSHGRGLDATPARPPQPTGAERDLDLAKRIARKMREMGRVPQSIARLHQVLRAKAGLS